MIQCSASARRSPTDKFAKTAAVFSNQYGIVSSESNSKRFLDFHSSLDKPSRVLSALGITDTFAFVTAKLAGPSRLDSFASRRVRRASCANERKAGCGYSASRMALNMTSATGAIAFGHSEAILDIVTVS